MVLASRIVTDIRALEFVSRECDTEFIPPVNYFGVERDGRIIAAAVFSVFTKADVHISVAGSCATKEFMRAIGVYVFDVLGMERFTAITEQPHVVRLMERIGGNVEGSMKNYFGLGRDGFICGVLVDKYKFRDQERK